MDDYNDSAAARRAEQSRNRRIIVTVVVLWIAIPLLFVAWNHWQRARQIEQVNTNYSAFVASVAQAETITDPLERCLDYPNLPGSHWHEDTTLAYCRLLNRHTLTRDEIGALLAQGKANEVDAAFQAYLNAQLHDRAQPGMFDSAFSAARFDHSDADTRKVIDQWKQQAPGSAFALVASGMQYLDAAQQARGYGWERDLDDGQVEGMNTQLTLARKDLDRAISLLPNATQAYRSMIYIAALSGDHATMYRAAKAGLNVDPANFGIRNQMMNQAQPKWGGLFGGEREQKKEDEQQLARNPLLRLTTSLPAMYAATCDCGDSNADYLQQVLPAADDNVSYSSLNNLAGVAYDSEPRLAIELYSESLRFHPTDPDVLRWRAQLMIKLGDRQNAVESVKQVAAHFPDNNDVAIALGNIYGQTGHVKEAEATYESILQRDPTHEKAMAWLGDLYNHAGHQPEKAKALADTLISRYPESPDGYIVRACYLMDHNLPGRYETIHYFIDHFGDRDEFKSQVAEMRAYLAKHPENVGLE